MTYREAAKLIKNIYWNMDIYHLPEHEMPEDKEIEPKGALGEPLKMAYDCLMTMAAIEEIDFF